MKISTDKEVIFYLLIVCISVIIVLQLFSNNNNVILDELSMDRTQEICNKFKVNEIDESVNVSYIDGVCEISEINYDRVFKLNCNFGMIQQKINMIFKINKETWTKENQKDITELMKECDIEYLEVSN